MQRRNTEENCYIGHVNTRQTQYLAVSTSSCHNSEQKMESSNLATRTTYHFLKVTSGAYFGKRGKTYNAAAAHTHFSFAAQSS